ncbi:MAG: transposase [Pseudanabaenales cyanobacterium]|nr:transposase [Pseudanabaenales cyanobacterium]
MLQAIFYVLTAGCAWYLLPKDYPPYSTLAVKVVAASTPEREGAKQLLGKVQQERERLPRLVRIWVDGGFSGKDFRHWVMDPFPYFQISSNQRDRLSQSRYIAVLNCIDYTLHPTPRLHKMCSTQVSAISALTR